MDGSLIFVLIVDTLAILISLIAIYKSNNTIDSVMDSIEEITKHIELKKRIEEEKKETNYEQAVKDMLDTLPKGSAKVIDEPIDNTVVIRIQKNVFMEE